MYRVMKSRIGKPWIIVEGDYATHDLRTLTERRGRWHTRLQLSEHATKDEAERELAHLTNRARRPT